MTIMKDFIKRNSTLIYFAMVFTISWGIILITVGLDGLGNPEDLNTPPVYVAMLLGPSLAGVLLTGFMYKRAGFREILSRLFGRQVSLRWYLISLLATPLLSMVVLFALSLISAEFIPHIVTTTNKTSVLLAGTLAGLCVGFFEELGWTGFAIPEMRRRYGILSTGVAMGLLWGAWHFILFWERESFLGMLSFVLLLARLFAWLPAYRVLMVWVYDRTGSLLVVMIMHMSLVAIQFILVPPLTETASLTYILVWAAVLWVVVAAVIFVQRRQIGKHRIAQTG